MFNRGQRTEHPLRSILLAVIIIFLALKFAPHLGAPDAPLPSCDAIVYDGSPFTCHYDGDLPGIPPVVHSVAERVVARNGYIPDGQCYRLVVQEIDRPEIHGTHCVSADVYNHFPVGSTYNG